MKKALFILIFIPQFLFAQQVADKEYYLIDHLVLKDLLPSDRSLLDSCIMIYHTNKEDTAKLKVLATLCDNLISDVWSDYQLLQYELIKKVEQKKLSNQEIGVLKLLKGGTYNNLGLIYEYQEGNINKALDFYLQALKLFNELEDKNGEAMMLNRIGTIYTSQDNPEKGFEYYQKSLKIYQELDEHKEISNTLNNLGQYYSGKGALSQALSYYNESLKIDNANGNQQGIATSYSNIGLVYIRQKEYDQALICLIKGLSIFEKIGNHYGQSLILNNIGKVHFSQGDLLSAQVSTEKSYKIAKNKGFPKRIESSTYLLSEIYEAQNKPQEALDMYKIHIALKDSLLNENTRVDAVKQQANYEFNRQKEIDDAVHDKEIALQQKTKEKQQIIIYAIGGGLGFLVLFFVFVFNRLQITRKQKTIIEEAHKELSVKNREILGSINYAKRIQTAILPTDEMLKKYLSNSFVFYQPKDIVAGDFYWLEDISSNQNEKKVLFAAADCTGHGVPGAMVSVVCNNALNRSVREYGLTIPGEILDKTREIVIEEFSADSLENKVDIDYVRDGMDIALCSLEANVLTYAGANNPLWIIRDGEIIETKADKQPVGNYSKQEKFTTHKFNLKIGDTIYVFSDGFVDQFGGKNLSTGRQGGKKYKIKAFRELLLSIQSKSMKNQHQIIEKVFDEWKGDFEQVDDVCVVGIRV